MFSQPSDAGIGDMCPPCPRPGSLSRHYPSVGSGLVNVLPSSQTFLPPLLVRASGLISRLSVALHVPQGHKPTHTHNNKHPVFHTPVPSVPFPTVTRPCPWHSHLAKECACSLGGGGG